MATENGRAGRLTRNGQHPSQTVFPLGPEKTPDSPTYRELVKKAKKEGRIGGAHRCPICGMRYHTTAEADVCCERVREKF